MREHRSQIRATHYGNGRTAVTMRESLAGPLLPLLYPPSQLQAGRQQWLAALKTALER